MLERTHPIEDVGLLLPEHDHGNLASPRLHGREIVGEDEVWAAVLRAGDHREPVVDQVLLEKDPCRGLLLSEEDCG
jgi:hypothetical protein